MDAKKRKRLEATGWQVGTAVEFLGLPPEEAALVETWLAVSAALRTRRAKSRVAKMEAGDPSVSLDLLLRAYFATGATRKDLAKVLTAPCRLRFPSSGIDSDPAHG